MSWACVGSWIFPALISVSAIRPPWAGRASHESRAQSQAGMSRCHAGHAGGHRWPTVTTITARCLYITSNNQDPDNSFRQLKRVKLDNLLNVKMTQDLDSGVLSGGCFVDFQKPQTLSFHYSSSFDGIIEVRKPPDPYNMHLPADIYCHNNFCWLLCDG